MIGETITCQNIGCDVVFTKKTHNQLYHNSECTRVATNAKIMEKYYEKQLVKSGAKRKCNSCGSNLSRYNSAKVCGPCSLSQEVEKNQSVMSMLSNVAWQN